MTIKLIIHDHVNFELQGLSQKEIDAIKKRTGIMVKGCFTTAAFKSKIWDGKESLFQEGEEPGTGYGVLYELDKILDVLEELGYDIDHDVSFEDLRVQPLPEDIEEVDDDYLMEESGFLLRDYQVDAINSAITLRKGILDIGTNGGKSWICVGISKAFDPYIKTVVIVPTEKLAKQTYADYSKTSLQASVLTASVPPKKRAAIIANNRHIILTTKLFINLVEEFQKDVWGIIHDETHTFGEVFADHLRFDMGHAPARIGMSGSIPKKDTDPFKRNKIFSIIGGGVLVKVRQRTLIERNISAELSIKMVETLHPEIEDVFDSMADSYDWSVEDSYNLNNRDRITTIAEYIKKNHAEDPVNTLILCHNGLGTILSEYLGCGLIVDETPSKERDELFNLFDTTDGHMFCATFGTSGTGISSNRIFRMYMIDVGKNETYIMQGIGRGLRLDGVIDKVEVIDVSSNNKYAKKHRTVRKRIYRREHFPFTEKPEKIMVIDGISDS